MKDIIEKIKYKLANILYRNKTEIFNRPLEGEIVKIENIKIKRDFKQPNKYKLDKRKNYFKKHRYFRSTIVLDTRNYLVDGYTTYLIAKEKGYEYITVVRAV